MKNKIIIVSVGILIPAVVATCLWVVVGDSLSGMEAIVAAIEGTPLPAALYQDNERGPDERRPISLLGGIFYLII